MDNRYEAVWNEATQKVDIVWHTENAGTVDAVEVVRCKDCKWHKQSCTAQYCDGTRRIKHICTLYGLGIIHLDWFCADGERKDNGKK